MQATEKLEPSLHSVLGHWMQAHQLQLAQLKSKRQTEQNMSPSTYQTLKEDYLKLQETLKTTKENLKKAREENLNGGILREK
jgi:hypothetical protein